MLDDSLSGMRECELLLEGEHPNLLIFHRSVDFEKPQVLNAIFKKNHTGHVFN